MFDLYEELRAITRALGRARIPYALAGGLAVGVYAAPRATEDIDLLADPDDPPRIFDALRPLGWRAHDEPTTFPRATLRRLVKVARDDALALDLLLAEDRVTRRILSERVRRGGLWVVPLEGLRTLKRRRGSAQDRADLDALARRRRP